MSPLLSSIAYELVIGTALAALVWLLGLGYLRIFSRDADAVFAYPIGLAACTAVSFAILLNAWVGLAATAVLLAPLVAATPWLRALNPRRALSMSLALFALPGAFGLMLHGPTRDLDSAVYGDTLYYVQKMASAVHSVVPFHDLLAEGERVIYAEAAPSFVGAVLSHLPGFDLILFQTTALPAFLFVSLAIGFGFARRDERASVQRPQLVAVLALASLFYPTWLIESPPTSLALPLAFAVYRLWSTELAFLRLAVVTALVTFDLLLTKVIGLIPVAALVGYVLYRRYWDGLGARSRAAVVGGVVAGAVVVIVVLFLTASWYRGLFTLRFLPWSALRGLHSELTTRSAAQLSPAFQVIGQTVLLIALVRARTFGIAFALAAGMSAMWVLGGQGLYMGVTLAILLAAVLFVTQPELLRAQLPLVAAAAVSLAVAGWVGDLSGVRAGLVLQLFAWAGILAAVRTARPLLPLGIVAVGSLFALSGDPYVGAAAVALAAVSVLVRPRAAPLAIAAALVIAVGVSANAIRDDDFHLSTFVSLTPADHDIWARVHHLVPANGLVFTSMTGLSVDGRHGWDNYPAVGQRQLYLAGWYDGRLTSDHAELRRRLALNRQVLDGRLAPSELPLSRRYGSYYAVLWRGERTPASFHRIYENDRFVLYRIES